MSFPNKILKPLSVFTFIGVLFCFLFAPELKAQNERDLVLPDEIKSENDNRNVAPMKEISQEPASDHVSSNRNRNIFETEKDKKTDKQSHKYAKNEEMSTLSFNLFLYVLDRFREDK